MFQKELRTWYLVALFATVPSSVLAQQTVRTDHTVRASAEATISAKPDEAELSFSVLSQAGKPEIASQQNAEVTSHLLESLKRLIGSNGDIKTSGLVTAPNIQYGSGGKVKINGYQTVNRLTVLLRDLSLVSTTVDTAVNAGATEVQGVTFSVSNDDSLRLQALDMASHKAYKSAEAVAKALNLSVIGVLDAQTNSDTPRSFPMGSTMQRVSVGPSVPTPIVPGDVDIRATVTVTVEVK